jgi:DNA-binding response OmpR family regulator
MRLLIVEDDASTRSALQQIYSRRGWTVDTAGTLAEAFDFLKLGPQFVILDLMLPDGEGSTLLRAIRDAGMPTRVAVTTGSNDVELIGAVMLLKPDFVLSKPIRLAELNTAIGTSGSNASQEASHRS